MRRRRSFSALMRRNRAPVRRVAHAPGGQNRPADPAPPDQGQGECGPVGRPAAAALYVLASALGAVLCLGALVAGMGAEAALKAYALPCAIVLSLHLGLAAARMTGLNRLRLQAAPRPR